MNATIWIKDPFPFRFDEYDTLQGAMQSGVYGSDIVYIREWPVDYVSADNTTITTCKQIATMLWTFHRYHAMLDKKYRGSQSNYCQDLEIVIQKPGDIRPDWAIAA